MLGSAATRSESSDELLNDVPTLFLFGVHIYRSSKLRGRRYRWRGIVLCQTSAVRSTYSRRVCSCIAQKVGLCRIPGVEDGNVLNHKGAIFLEELFEGADFFIQGHIGRALFRFWCLH